MTEENVYYRNLYDSCLSDSRCNLDVYVAENNLDPNHLTASITEPIKYNTLRETLAYREMLLDAGYHLNDFDAQVAQETGDFGITFNNEKTQPMLNENTVNYSGIQDAISKLNLTYQTMTTSTVQNSTNNTNDTPENQGTSSGNNTNDLLKIGGVAVIVAIVAAVAIKGSKRK